MKPIGRRGLSFRRKRRKVTATGAKHWAFFVFQIAVVLGLSFFAAYSLGMRVTVMGSSMEDTLEDGDTVFVNRVAYLVSEPQAGDIVVFLLNGNEKDHYYVKRVVAVPGDTVQIVDGVLYVNGEMYDEEDTEAIKTAGLAQEEITLGEDEYFVLGDNRNSSEDSRYTSIGNVSLEDIAGKAWFYYGSLNDLGRVK